MEIQKSKVLIGQLIPHVGVTCAYLNGQRMVRELSNSCLRVV